MALIAMCCYDTEENGRSEYTERTLERLARSLNKNHRLVVVDNGSCEKTKGLLLTYQLTSQHPQTFYAPQKFQCEFILITNKTNVGTAAAINQAWAHRLPNEHLIKMDNDCLVNYEGDWVGEMEQAIERDPNIGIIGLKRKDLGENPWRTDWLASKLHMLPHEAGQPWIIVEKVNHVMGTACCFNHRLIDKIGGLYQMGGIYGFDDSLAAVRCELAGFYNCFLPHIDIDHIDRGDTPYQKEKEAYALSMMDKYNEVKAAMQSGKQSIYFPL